VIGVRVQSPTLATPEWAADAQVAVVVSAAISTASVIRTNLLAGFRHRLFRSVGTALLMGECVHHPIWRRRGDGVRNRTRTLAVLPFTNLSGNAKQEYFSDGMSEVSVRFAGNSLGGNMTRNA
jgi:hypothetical protein